MFLDANYSWISHNLYTKYFLKTVFISVFAYIYVHSHILLEQLFLWT